jgi:PST family polysaccharide transporter
MKVARSVSWNIFTGLGSRAVGLIGTLVLTRFIAPEEYGQLSTATIAAMTAGYLVNLQFGQYIIIKGYRGHGVAYHAAVCHVCLGWTAITLAFLGRDFLGPWLGSPGMGRFMWGFALAAAMDTVSIVPEKILAREMLFRRIAVTKGIGELLFTTLALSLVSYLGGMALVVGAVCRSAFVMTVFLTRSDRIWMRPVSWSWPLVREMVKYSSPLALANMTDFATARWDNLLIGKFHGSGVMGTYNLAYNLSSTSTLAVAEHIADVLFPSFARLEPRQRGQALVRAVSAMAFVVFPLGLGLGAVASDVVGAVFTSKWALIAPMLTVLSVYAAIQPPGWTFRAFYKAQGRTTFVMLAGVFRLALMLTGIATVGRLGPLWACAAVDFAFVAHFVLMWSGLRRDHAAQAWPAARGVLQVLAACLPMILAVLGIQALERRFFPLPPVWALCLEIPVGALGYAAGAALFARATALELLSLGARLIGRGRRRLDGQEAAE